ALRGVGAEDMPEDGQFADIHRSVDRLSDRMDLEKPRLMVAEMGVPNAFAVGRRGAGVVVVSKELIQLLDHDELEGVLAHELAHIDNRDVVMMVLGQSLASLVGMVVQWGVILSGDNDLANFFLGMIAGTIAQFVVIIFLMAISRYREYVADGDAARHTGNPDAMARALEKISEGATAKQEAAAAQAVAGGSGRRGRGNGRQRRGSRGSRRGNEGGVPDDVAALCIFEGDRGILRSILATHPPVEKRIERLRNP
ncbi:MAG: M48 family metalloprotease, partial [Haloarculaceae archaeon]